MPTKAKAKAPADECCNGRVHVVCRPGSWAAASVSAFLEADKSKAPALAKTFDCGCRGAAHLVCEPRWKRIKEKHDAQPAKRMTLKQALKDGLALKPHIEHTFTCQVGCKASSRHEHWCYCNRGEYGTGRPFTEAERGQTIRVPIEGRG
jgi:hypothetical protein